MLSDPPPLESLVDIDLFDRSGILNLDQFAPDGQVIIQSACVRANEAERGVIDLPVLLRALFKESKTARNWLETQGFSPATIEQFFPLSSKLMQESRLNPRLQNLQPSQFDIWITVLEILEQAWQQACQEHSKIAELHIIHGLISSPRIRASLEKIGLDFAPLQDYG